MTDSDRNRLPLSRRRLLQGGIGLGVAGMVGLGVWDDDLVGETSIEPAEPTDRELTDRLSRAYAIRETDAAESTRERETVTTGEYGSMPHLAGTFGKGLPKRNEFGELDPEAHETLERALEEGTTDAFERVPLAGDKPLANPQAALSFNMSGADPHTVPIRGHPPMGSDEAAAEMVEMYWAALLRDVPFAAYDSDETAQTAYDELTGLAGYEGPDNGGPGDSLYRDRMPGCGEGPLVSQFFLRDADYGAVPVSLQVDGKAPGVDYMTDHETWLSIQRGETGSVVEEPTRGDRRYITTGRDLATFVEFNLAYHPFLHAALLLEGGYAGTSRDLHDDANPQVGVDSQNTFIDYGTITAVSAVAEVTRLVQRANWFHKWLGYRRARPEEYGGRVHVHNSEMDRTYDFLTTDLLESTALRRSRERTGAWLLPMAYSQGCPTHPSYPAGHAGIAGACGTVMKGLFDGDAELPVVYETTADGERTTRDDLSLTVGGEVNKLVSNHEMGRLFAGLHYRTDGIDGFLMGEALAVTYLQDLLREFAAAPDGPMTLTSYTGETVSITPETITRG